MNSTVYVVVRYLLNVYSIGIGWSKNYVFHPFWWNFPTKSTDEQQQENEIKIHVQKTCRTMPDKWQQTSLCERETKIWSKDKTSHKEKQGEIWSLLQKERIPFLKKLTQSYAPDVVTVTVTLRNFCLFISCAITLSLWDCFPLFFANPQILF